MQRSRRLGPLVAVALACVHRVVGAAVPDRLPARGVPRALDQVFDRIGTDAVAVVQGVPLTNGYQLPRQSNTFYYLSGIETPHAYLMLDGRTRQVTLYLPPRNERLERVGGQGALGRGRRAREALTGADDVLPTPAMGDRWPLGDGSPQRSTRSSRPPKATPRAAASWCRPPTPSIASDFWDGRMPREKPVRELLSHAPPRVELQDLTPILDELRSDQEPARDRAHPARVADRRARPDGGDASTEPGVVRVPARRRGPLRLPRNGARLDGYRSITASGTENI